MRWEGASGKLAGELRRMTVVFADLSNYTRLTAAHDPEEIAITVNEIEARCERIVEAYGGVVNQVRGDGFLLLFGADVAHEDDPLRATEACLALHRVVRELEPPWGDALTLHSGIQTGPVFVAPGNERDGRYVVTGEAVNVASRFSGAAGADEILVGEGTYRQIARRFAMVAPRALELRGVPGPVLAYRVTGQAVRARQAARLVGRSDALHTLRACFDSARTRRAGLVVLTGEAGIGKTRLTREFSELVSGHARVVTARCRAYPPSAPYAPLSQLVRGAVESEVDRMPTDDLARHLAALDPNLASSVPALVSLVRRLQRDDPLAPSGEPELQRHNIIDGLTELLRAWAASGPLVVVLEDWHEVDDPSHAALVEMLRRLHGEPILFLATCRPAGLSRFPDMADQVVPLAPLTRDETGTLVSRLCYLARVPGRFVDAVYERTQGNPFFVEEVCHALSESDSVHTAVASSVFDRTPLPIPETIDAVLAARIDRLDGADRNLLKAAAVLGQEFSGWRLRELITAAPSDESMSGELPWPHDVEASLERVAGAGLLVTADRDGVSRFRFKHAIVRTAAYDLLTRRQRRALHARATRALLATGDPRSTPGMCAALAHHLVHAGQYEEAIDYAEQAGDEAAERFSLEEARQQYRNAIRCLDRDSRTTEQRRRRVAISLKWAAACVYRPALEQLDVLGVSRRHAEELGEVSSAAHCLYWMGWIAHALGDQASSIEYTNAGLEQRCGDLRLESQLHCNVGLCYAAATEYDTALAHLDRGLSVRQRDPDCVERMDGAYVYTVGHRGLIHACCGRFAEADRYLNQALQKLRQERRVALQGSVLTLLAMARLVKGDWEGSIDAAAEIQAIGEQIHGPYIVAMSATAASYAQYQLRRDPEAIATMQSAASWLRDHDVCLTLSWNYALLAEVCADAREVARAREHADTALARGRWDCLGAVAAHRARAVAAAHEEGAPEAAAPHMKRALAHARAHGMRPEAAITEYRHATLFAEYGRAEAAAACATRALAAFRELHMRWYADRAQIVLTSLA